MWTFLLVANFLLWVLFLTQTLSNSSLWKLKFSLTDKSKKVFYLAAKVNEIGIWIVKGKHDSV